MRRSRVLLPVLVLVSLIVAIVFFASSRVSEKRKQGKVSSLTDARSATAHRVEPVPVNEGRRVPNSTDPARNPKPVSSSSLHPTASLRPVPINSPLGLQGQVINARTRRAVGAAELTLWNVSGQKEASTKSDGSGFFRIAVDQAGGYTIEAQASGFQKSSITGVTILGPSRNNLLIALTPVFQFRVGVVDDVGRGIPSAGVWLWNESKEKVDSGKTGPDGVWLGEKGLADGKYTITCWASGHEMRESESLSVPENDSATVRMSKLRRRDLSTVSGVVRETKTGRLLSSIKVNLGLDNRSGPKDRSISTVSTTVTLPDGLYRFAEVPHGRYLVSAWGEGYLGGGEGATAAFESDPPQEYHIDLLLTPVYQVSGIVQDEQGIPVARAMVHAQIERSLGAGTVSDQAGRFTLESVPAGNHMLRVEQREFCPHERQIEVASDVDLRIVLERGVTVTGTLSTDTGRPLTDFSLIFSSASEGATVKRVKFSTLEGLFQVKGLPQGSYRVSVEAEAISASSALDVSTDCEVIMLVKEPSSLTIRRVR
jgi:hypothetical protein